MLLLMIMQMGISITTRNGTSTNNNTTRRQNNCDTNRNNIMKSKNMNTTNMYDTTKVNNYLI